jgi:hypothetical protein
MLNLYKYKHDLEQNKSFRDSEMRRLLLLRSQSEDFNTINVCNLILSYIYDLNWSNISSQNNKFRAKGAF